MTSGLLLAPSSAFAFTQGVKDGGYFVPMGHEWITCMAAIELLDGMENDPKDPRKQKDWVTTPTNLSLEGADAVVKKIRASRTDETRYAAKYKAVYSAIIGERWVDIGGVSLPAAKAVSYNCLDLVTQEPISVQYDHFMRRADDVGGAGGIRAAQESAARFVTYFRNAALAAEGDIKVWDGGAVADLETVNRNYFLFGRALHLLEDSFSPDHTVRSASDGYRTVKQVKSYLCAKGSEQHAHETPGIVSDAFWKTGDVIFESAYSGYLPSNMRRPALAAAEATKDAWAAFIRTLAEPIETRGAKASEEANAIVKRWMSYDETEMTNWYSVNNGGNRGGTYVWNDGESGKGTDQAGCMKRDWKGATQAQKLKDFEAGRRICLYNMRAAEDGGDVDPSLHLAYNWEWRATDFIMPPPDWKIGDPTTQWQVILRSALHEEGYIRREGTTLYNDPKAGTNAVSFFIGANLDDTVLEASDLKGNYVNMPSGGKGWAKLWESTDKGHFSLIRRTDNGYYNIRNTYSKAYMWSSNDAPYVSGDGANNKNAQWQVIGLPEPFPLDGNYRLRPRDRVLSVNGKSLSSVKYVGNPDGAVIGIERQSDGSHMFKIGANYVGVSAKDQSVSVTPGRAGNEKRFIIEMRRKSMVTTYAIRSVATQTYWVLSEDGALVSATGYGSCLVIDPCNPVITGGGGLSGGGGKGGGPWGPDEPDDPDCKSEPVQPTTPCVEASTFIFDRVTK